MAFRSEVLRPVRVGLDQLASSFAKELIRCIAVVWMPRGISAVICFARLPVLLPTLDTANRRGVRLGQNNGPCYGTDRGIRIYL